MTLIVGCATRDIGFLVGDTRVSFGINLKGKIEPINGQTHTLKIRIITENIAVAFAGDVDPSLAIIKDLQAELARNPTLDVCQWVFETYARMIVDKMPDCEFLVLQLTPAGRVLSRITREGVQDCQRGYIGDPAEYKSLMKSIRQYPYDPPTFRSVQQADGSFVSEPLALSEGEVYFGEASNAMERLTTQWNSRNSAGAISSCVTRVTDARISRALEYLQYHVAEVSPEDGTSGCSLFASNREVRGVGIYFPRGKMGYLFVVGDSEYSRTEFAETKTDFFHAARVKYGLRLE
jgi:hypothetical protein